MNDGLPSNRQKVSPVYDTGEPVEIAGGLWHDCVLDCLMQTRLESTVDQTRLS